MVESVAEPYVEEQKQPNQEEIATSAQQSRSMYFVDQAGVDPMKILNINIGVLGHIDSGKTSLCRALSTVTSTASLDKSPQSKERGITLDLGFSAFMVNIPEWLRQKEQEKLAGVDFIQFTLVDCPGHASLMKTVIGGASIIDLMVLVVDCQKLIQTQTFECIVLGEILMDKLIIAFNKVDLLKSEPPKLAKQLQTLKAQITRTKFGPDTQIVPVSAFNAAAAAGAVEEAGDPATSEGIDDLITAILQQVEIPDRNRGAAKDFLFAIDHCFQIKGKGTVVTGTVLAGQAAIGDTIELPMLKQDKKIKSMQMFRKPVQRVKQGDRVGICLAQLDASKIERGIAAKPRSVKTFDLAIVIVRRVPYFQQEVRSKAKFHISMGHQTAIGMVTFFSCEAGNDAMATKFNQNSLKSVDQVIDFDWNKEYLAEEILAKQRKQQQPKQQVQQEEEKKGQAQNNNSGAANKVPLKTFYAIVKFERDTLAQEQTLLIGSKLDAETAQKQCRLCFYGQVLALFPSNQSADERNATLERLKVIKHKNKVGKIDKVVNERELHVRDLFSKETQPDIYLNLQVTLMALEGEKTGKIIGTFGKSGKLRVKLDEALDASVDQRALLGSEVMLRYKKNMMKKQVNKFR